MAIQYSVTVRNGILDSIETSIGASPILRIRTGAQPANCAAARSGTVLASMTLPADWMAAAASGAKAKAGTWQDLLADATGTAGHYEIVDSGGTVCHEQGSVTATGGGGDLTLDNVSIATNQPVVITSYGLTAAGA